MQILRFRLCKKRTLPKKSKQYPNLRQLAGNPPSWRAKKPFYDFGQMFLRLFLGHSSSWLVTPPRTLSQMWQRSLFVPQLPPETPFFWNCTRDERFWGPRNFEKKTNLMISKAPRHLHHDAGRNPPGKLQELSPENSKTWDFGEACGSLHCACAPKFQDLIPQHIHFHSDCHPPGPVFLYFWGCCYKPCRQPYNQPLDFLRHNKPWSFEP